MEDVLDAAAPVDLIYDMVFGALLSAVYLAPWRAR